MSSSDDEAHEDAPSEPSSEEDDAEHIAALMKLGDKPNKAEDKKVSKVSEPSAVNPPHLGTSPPGKGNLTAQDNQNSKGGRNKTRKKSALGRSRSKKFNSFFE